MLDFGWSEFFLIMVVAIVMMGPRDIPYVIYQAGRFVRRLQYMKFAMTQQFDSFMEQNDLQELRKGRGLGADLGLGDVRHAMSLPPEKTAATPPISNPIEDEQDEAFFAGIDDLSKAKDHDNK